MGAETSKRKNPKQKVLNEAIRKTILDFFNLSRAGVQKVTVTNVELTWKQCVDPHLFACLMGALFQTGSEAPIHRLTDIYYDLILGSVDEKTQVTLDIAKGANLSDSQAEAFHMYVKSVINTLVKLYNPRNEMKGWRSLNQSSSFDDNKSLAKFLTTELPVNDNGNLSQDDVERWLYANGTFKEVSEFVYKSIFNVKDEHKSFVPLPEFDTKQLLSSLLTILTTGEILFMNCHLPSENTLKWRFLYSSNVHGQSWQTMYKMIVAQGPSLVIIEDKKGNVFGAFATDSWKNSPNFYGSEASFLFTLRPEIQIFEPTGFNKNFQYINSGAATLPNGMGFGGTRDYFGFFLSADYGIGKVGKSCTTYRNYKMPCSAVDFEVYNIEVWGVGEREPTAAELGERTGFAMDKDPAAAAILELAGRTMHSNKEMRKGE